MKPNVIASILAFLLLNSFLLLPQSVKWEDRMNGNNSIAGLQARGWVVLNEDGGGSTPAWFQGNILYFNSYEGPDSGYVAADYDGANSSNVIDQWLISPAITVVAGDSLSFFARSPNQSAYDDSITILISPTAGTSTGSFIQLGRFLVSKSGWGGFYVVFSVSATIRFAVRYYLFDAVTRSEYVGLDLFQIFSKSSYPSSINISKTFSFNDITQSSSYRMVSLPGELNVPLSQLITGTQKTDWNAYYDNGAASNYLIEHDGSANFNFKPGNGFWLLSKNPLTLNFSVNSVVLSGDNTRSIDLHSGWNIISNPFERSTNWSAVQFANLLDANAIIYDWGGSWTNPTLFSPYKAYYFNNVNNQTALWIPYDPSGALGKSSQDYTVEISKETDIKLSLHENGEEKSRIFVGYDSESSIDFDKHDYFAPPGDFEEARIAIRNDNLFTDYKFLMKESRKEVGDGQIYNLEIKNLTRNELTLNINGLTNYSAYQVYLIDERLNNSIKISDDSKINIPAHLKNTNYKLLIGNQSFIQSNGGNTVPTSFALYQNYPNPFNPATTIRYSVPIDSKVSIKIFDLLGNELAALLTEEKSPGNYEIELDLSKFSSGVYIYQIQAGKFTDSKKMILLR